MSRKSFALLFTSILFVACSSQETPWRPVRGKDHFVFSSNLECQILTSTDTTKEKEIFKLYGMDKDLPVIEFEGSNPEQQILTKLEDIPERISFSMLSKTRGARMIFVEKTTGVVGMAVSPDRNFTPETELAFRGNCSELKDATYPPKPLQIQSMGSGTNAQ